jgi:hypothetical protein
MFWSRIGEVSFSVVSWCLRTTRGEIKRVVAPLSSMARSFTFFDLQDRDMGI